MKAEGNWRPRFSLRTLVLFMCMVGSGFSLRYRWEPWVAQGKSSKSEQALWPVFSPKGQLKLIRDPEIYGAQLVNTRTNEVMQLLEGHDGQLYSATFSPNGQLIASASSDWTTRIWNVNSGVCESVLKAHQGAVYNVSFSDDNSQIVSASQDRTAMIWEVKGGRLVQVLKGHKGFVMDARFFPDGRRIATCGWDGTTRIWSARNGTCLFVLKGAGGSRITEISDGNMIILSAKGGEHLKCHRRRPEQWYGIFWLWEAWAVLAFGIGLAWSAWKDWKRLMPVWKPMDIGICPECRSHLPRGVTSCWNPACDFQLPEYTSASGSDE